MTPLPMHTPDGTAANVAAIAALFPHCITESRNAAGAVVQAVDFDLLRQELSASIVEGPQERYQLNWPGKRDALLAANAPIAKTLRPDRAGSVDFDTTQNLYIEGDNLDALKLLQETYLGAVKMIYIDPPYNTREDLIYMDDFAQDSEEYLRLSQQVNETGERMVANTEANGRFHSDWLTMMYQRLKLARNLLTEDGVIFISIDDNENHNLRRLCDEIFGQTNFAGTIVWKKKTNGNNVGVIPPVHDYFLGYCKNKLRITDTNFGLPLTQEYIKANYSNPDNDERGPWTTMDLSANHKGPNFKITNPVTTESHLPSKGRYWVFNEKEVAKRISQGRIIFGKNGTSNPVQKVFLSDRLGKRQKPNAWWDKNGMNEDGTTELSELFNAAKIFDHPKPSITLSQLINISTNKSDLILDFFSGSATTAHAVMQLNAEDGGSRRFILVQLPEVCAADSEAAKAGYATIAEIGKERIRRAGAKITADVAVKHAAAAPVAAATPLDTGFRVLKVDTSNMADVYYTPDATTQAQLATLASNIKPERSAEDLLFQVLLDCGVDLAAPVSSRIIAGKTVWMATEPSGAVLLACFDDAGGINDALVRALAEQQPARVVFRDAGFANDSVKINVEQLFKALSPTTEIRVL